MIKKIIENFKKNYQFVITILCFLLFLLILRDTYIYEIVSYDELFKKIFVDKLRNDTVTNIMKIITFFGSGTSLISIIILLFLILKNKKYAYLAGINLFLVTILNALIKIIIKRPRPVNINIIVENGFSFPSGHSMISAAFYGFIIYIV